MDNSGVEEGADEEAEGRRRPADGARGARKWLQAPHKRYLTVTQSVA